MKATKPDGRWQQPTGISPRLILMSAPRNALRAFNAGVSLSERRSLPTAVPCADANWLNRSPKSSSLRGSRRAICWALLRSVLLSGSMLFSRYNILATRAVLGCESARKGPYQDDKSLSLQIHKRPIAEVRKGGTHSCLAFFEL